MTADRFLAPAARDRTPGGESWLRAALPALFALLLLGNLYVAFKLCARGDGFSVVDWLINYQGGFVRRGLAGEIILHLSSWTRVAPAVWVLGMHAACFGTYLLCSFLLLRRQARLLPYALLIFSPFLFRFPIHDEQGAFRKEIIYFAVLAVNVWAVVTPRPGLRRWVFRCTLAGFPLMVLAHEMLLVFLPVLAAVHVWRGSLRARGRVAIAVALVLAAGAFLASALTEVDRDQIQAIRRSLPSIAAGEGGAIDWLARGGGHGRAQVRVAIATKGYVPIYLACALLAAAAFVPVRRRLNVLRRPAPALALCAALAGGVPLFATALDWGRFLNIYLVTLFLLTFLPGDDRARADSVHGAEPSAARPALTPRRRQTLRLALLILYALSWHIPHCCGDAFLSRWVLASAAGAARLLAAAAPG